MHARTRRRSAAAALLAAGTLLAALVATVSPAGAQAQVPADGRVSVDSDEGQADDTDSAPATSFTADITPDGRFVAFQSSAADLVVGDGNDIVDVFVRDRLLGTTERVSVSSAEVAGDDASSVPTSSRAVSATTP